jgi:glutaredoxin
MERNPAARTMPQIFINNQLIGGFTDLEAWLENNN